jgi:predicted nucleic acid-binding protein
VGAGQLSVAVLDAGPLIHLAEIDCLSPLRIFDTLYVPDAVWLEVVEQGRVSQDAVLGLGTVHRYKLPRAEVEQFVQEHGLEDFHGGERECLYLCRKARVSILLTDDLAVRDVAKQLNLTPVGSLGVVAKAYRLGYVSLVDAERHIADLYDVSSLFVTRAIVDLAVGQLRERSN